MNVSALAIMAKQPRVGQTKTRLSPPLTPTQAACLYEGLLLDTIDLVVRLEGIDLAIAVTPPEATGYFARIAPPGARLLPVACPDIGNCLQQVLGSLLAFGHSKALALNSDGPSLPPEYIQQAIDLLDQADVVLGPGEDGGYYLVGLKTLHPEIFTGLDWSTSSVFAQTLAKSQALGLEVAVLPAWYDVDTAADLARLLVELDRLPADRLAHTRRALEGLQ